MSYPTATYGDVKQIDQIDIDELSTRIVGFHTGQEDEDRFKLYRLTRGVYGQRQLGVHMFRLKIPSGKVTTNQIVGIADLSDQYGSSNLHLTTRQNVQLHYVKLNDSPAVWEGLSKLDLTAREACGNTVRNICASPTAGIQPGEAFDVTEYVEATYQYFLRNPICQEMGRKIKPAFSATDADTAFTYFSDFGFIPKIKDGVRGFKFVVGGGLGAQAITAQLVSNFIPTDKIIPFMIAAIRVFDRYGEREKRHKARMKFLLKSLGLEEFLNLVNEELKSVEEQTIEIAPVNDVPDAPTEIFAIDESLIDKDAFDTWLQSNTFDQRQEGYKAAYIRVPNGDIPSDDARKLAKIIKKYAADDVRITIDQNLLLRYILPANLAALYQELNSLGYAHAGAGSIVDITACPGTDTCNLGVTNSTALSLELEKMINSEYANLLTQKGLDIKISGCMNACGQHMASSFGFHGSSIKRNDMVIPAMQVIVGGGIDKAGVGFIGDKVIKLPTKRIPESIRLLIADFEDNKVDNNEEYVHYVSKQDRKYFYNILKPLADIESITTSDLQDWGQETSYVQEIGVGECAGVIIDMVATILGDAEGKIDLAIEAYKSNNISDAVYHAYNIFIISAKAMLLSDDIKCNTQIKILDDFQANYIETGKLDIGVTDFPSYVLRLKAGKPTEAFAKEYIKDAQAFLRQVKDVRAQKNDLSKEVVGSYYKA